MQFLTGLLCFASGFIVGIFLLALGQESQKQATQKPNLKIVAETEKEK